MARNLHVSGAERGQVNPRPAYNLADGRSGGGGRRGNEGASSRGRRPRPAVRSYHGVQAVLLVEVAFRVLLSGATENGWRAVSWPCCAPWWTARTCPYSEAGELPTRPVSDRVYPRLCLPLLGADGPPSRESQNTQSLGRRFRVLLTEDGGRRVQLGMV